MVKWIEKIKDVLPEDSERIKAGLNKLGHYIERGALTVDRELKNLLTREEMGMKVISSHQPNKVLDGFWDSIEKKKEEGERVHLELVDDEIRLLDEEGNILETMDIGEVKRAGMKQKLKKVV